MIFQTRSLHPRGRSDRVSPPARSGRAVPPPTVIREIQPEFEPRERRVRNLLLITPVYREIVRGLVAAILLSCLAGTIYGMFQYIFYSAANQQNNPAQPYQGTTTEAKDLITLIWTSEVGLVGSALGFYFGSRDKDSN